jgi:hypothetical protein
MYQGTLHSSPLLARIWTGVVSPLNQTPPFRLTAQSADAGEQVRAAATARGTKTYIRKTSHLPFRTQEINHDLDAESNTKASEG